MISLKSANCVFASIFLSVFSFQTIAATTQPVPAYWSSEQRAQNIAFHGEYPQALTALSGDRSDAANLIRAQCLAATGQVDAALTLLANKPDAKTESAQIFLDTYQPDRAHTLLTSYLASHAQSIPAHYLLGQSCENLSDLDAARAAYSWFSDQKYLDRWQQNPDDPIFANAADVVTIGRALNRLAILNGSYAHDPSLHQRLLDLFVRSYDVIDREYWPAHLAAAEYFLAHDQEKEAGEELQATLAANPNNQHALDLDGRMALANFDFDSADKSIARIHSVNPHSLTADLLEARSLLRQQRPHDSDAILQRVLAQRPHNIEALSLAASAAALELNEAEEKKILAQLNQFAPHDATAYQELGDQLAAMRQYPESEAMYKTAIARAPWWSEPQNAMGLLYTQSGDEASARTTLTAAHAMDPYDLRTTNYLRLLDDLDHFSKKESAHFVVSYDAKTDSILADYLPAYLESMYPQVCQTFQHEPAVKTFIEVFPTHAEFSVRTTGTPWIGTVGASTGRVVALVAPREGTETLGNFNWAEVLHHEFTHTVTLSATDNRISHWMTEGLATLQEGTPLRWEWVPMIYQAVKKNQLFSIQQLTWAFVRPKRPIDRQLAYAESYWICQHIRDTKDWGWGAILKMMDSYRRGETESQVFKNSLGIDDMEFFHRFTTWTQQQISTWGYDPASDAQYDALSAQAQALINEQDFSQALLIWKKIAALRPMDELPHKRLAGLYLQLHDQLHAIAELAILDNLSLKDNRYAKAIARLYRDLNDPANERTFALRAVWINPYDPRAHELLLDALQRLHDPQATHESAVISFLQTRK